jgi:hypothetical protein
MTRDGKEEKGIMAEMRTSPDTDNIIIRSKKPKKKR